MSPRQLNATAASLLGFLHDGPLTGWDLVAAAQQVIGDFWSLTQSQVYRELAWMAGEGLIQAGERGPRHRQPYALTATGRRAFAEWTTREPGSETIRFPLLLRISFGRHVPPDRLTAFVRSHRAVHATRLASYEAYLDTPGSVEAGDPYREATLDFGIRYERAVLDWFDHLPATIRGEPRP